MLFSQLGHDELLIVVLEQIGSSAQATPGRSAAGLRLGSREALWQMLLAPTWRAQGHWKCQCSSLSVVPQPLWQTGTWALHRDLCQFFQKFQAGRAGFHSPETALSLQSPRPSDTPAPMGPSLPFSLLPAPAALCGTISAGKSDLQRLIKIKAMGREAESYNDGCSQNSCPEAEVLWAFGAVCVQPRSCAIVKHT